MSSGEIEGAAAFPHTFQSLFEDAESALRRLGRVASLLFVAYDLKLRQFRKIMQRLSDRLNFAVSRSVGLYLDLKRGKYYAVRIRSGGRLLSKYVGKNPGNLPTLIEKFQEMKQELDRLEDYMDIIEDTLNAFISKANWITELIQNEVEENVGTQ